MGDSTRPDADRAAAMDWKFSGEVGSSSETMCRAFLGYPEGRHSGLPCDGDDFARCRLFVERLSASGKLAALSAVSARHKEWVPLARDWDAICAQMDKDCPAWRLGGSRLSEQVSKMLGIRKTEGYRLAFPKAEIHAREDGTFSSMYNPSGPSEVVFDADALKRMKILTAKLRRKRRTGAHP